LTFDGFFHFFIEIFSGLFLLPPTDHIIIILTHFYEEIEIKIRQEIGKPPSKAAISILKTLKI
jgi:hypothetical protein